MTSKNIIVCNNNGQVDASLKSTMKKMGYQILEVNRGKECIDLVAQHPSAIVLLEIDLPDSSGYDICQQINANRSVSQNIIFIASSQKYKRVGNELIEAKADFYVTKPYKPNDLASDLYYLSRCDFTPDFETLADLRVTRSIVQNGDRYGQDIDLEEESASLVPKEKSPEKKPSPNHASEQVSIEAFHKLQQLTVSLVKRIQTMEKLLEEKQIIDEDDVKMIKLAAAQEALRG